MNLKLTATLLLCFAASPMISAQRMPSVEGVVVAAETRTPLTNAVVALASNTGAAIKTTKTDEEGKFLFFSIPAGEYRIAATRDGYIKAEYGQRYPEGPSLKVSVTTGRPALGIELAMTAGGIISGHVTGRGGPASQTRIYALRAVTMDGDLNIIAMGSDLTNDRGEYRLFWLPPGRYFVLAGMERYDKLGGILTRTTDPRTREDRQLAGSTEGPAPVFYPGTTDFTAATAVDVIAGGESANVNMDISPMPLRTIRGTLSANAVNRGAGVTATPIVPPIVAINSGVAGNVFNDLLPQPGGPDASGAFEIRNLIAGIYAVRAPGFLETLVDVRDHDAQGVQLTLAEGIRLTGEALVEGREGRATGSRDPVLAGIHVTLTNDRRSPAGIGNEISGSLDPATGVLNIPASSSPEEIRRTGPTPGVWRVSVSPLLRRPTAPGQQRSATPDNLARAYVKSIRFGDEDLPDGTLRLDGPADRQLIIVIGTNPGVVRGRVVDSSDRPMSAMTVVAIPDNGQRFRTDHRFTASDAEGQFLLENMPPGAYKIYAWEQVFPGAWQDSSFIQPYESQGHPISVEEDSTVVVDIRGIPARKR